MWMFGKKRAGSARDIFNLNQPFQKYCPDRLTLLTFGMFLL